MHICIYTLGQTEEMVDQLRSILAQLQFKYEIEQYEAKRIPFSTYLYVPEEHPETKSIFMNEKMRLI